MTDHTLPAGIPTIGVPCPACNAGAGERCNAPTDTGRRPVTWLHTARVPREHYPSRFGFGTPNADQQWGAELCGSEDDGDDEAELDLEAAVADEDTDLLDRHGWTLTEARAELADRRAEQARILADAGEGFGAPL